MKKLILALLLCCSAAVAVYGFEVSVPNEVPGYKDLVVTLALEPGEAVVQARFYFLQEGNAEPFYAEFAEKDGAWTAVVPYDYLRGEELVYFTQVQTDQGKYVRNPVEGTYKARLIQDVSPPVLSMRLPDKKALVKGKEQLVIFEIADESGLADFEVLYNGKPLAEAIVNRNLLSLLVKPANDRNKTATVDISMVDLFGNKATQQFSFSLNREVGPFFSAQTDYTASLDAEYSMKAGETSNTTDLGAFFSDMQHDLTLDFTLGGETTLKAGPLALRLALELGDSISVQDLPVAYPNTLIADFQNIMNLWHPWNFDNEFNYGGEVARKFYNSNKFLVRFSILDPVLTYTFGDQKVSFQKETVKDFEFRGTALSLDIPFLSVSVSKGLSDLGLDGTAWPQNFFGLKAGIDVFDYWWLQTNVSFISSLQGPYDTIASGTSPIGTLYHLEDVKPEENLVFGLGTGTDNRLFKLSAGLGLTLYADDAGDIIDKEQLAADVQEGFDFDISTYLGYVDAVDAIFPVFDYFPLSMGIVAKALNRELWGITYGADLEVTSIGLTGWFHKTDSAYKSLGASVDTDLMDIGVFWEKPLWDFNFSLGYNWTKDNIPDIIFSDILPLFGISSTADPTVDDISDITNTLAFAVDTPSIGSFGNIAFSYTFEWVAANADKLAEDLSGAAATALTGSDKNDSTLTHTGSLQWKSGKIKFGDFLATVGAKTKDSFITYTVIDGVDDGSNNWELSYGIDTGLQYDRYKLNLGFEHAWETTPASDVVFGYDAKFTVLKSFFDKMAFDGSFDQIFNNAEVQKYGIGAGFTLEKRFGIVNTSAAMKIGFVDSLVDNADDALTSTFTISGGISL
ncbi:MAG: hypothetical protein WAZ31_09385 [Rectinemataceae bacterium]